MRSYSGRSCALTPEQLVALKAAYELHTDNAPPRLAQRFGVSKQTVYAYVRGRHKIGPVRRAAAAVASDDGRGSDGGRAP